ncbi:PadR family transcriptional regulator [Novosphingobium cyanobacteriorum]|uniref:PadR family transcriptional regulator n=1 Tax=Novosphingobium cyanobacteriorum TaxID=3024215 RepID=A0ABT6CEM5_9SPHN|nr:PadR family transcriptional regulator [Novosphingobium cyanobacteriorum]MDF8332377.1 PadR family transcriptional regulator [Novosphingobium cyanobacteriorum]
MRIDHGMRGIGRGHGPGNGGHKMKMMMGEGLRRGMRAGFGGGFGGGFGDDEEAGMRGGFGRGGRGGGGGRGGRGRMFASGELRLTLLHLVSQQDRHGYELIKAIEDLTGGHYAPSPGVVYPTLSLLVDEGLIAEVPGEGARKAFTATDAGRKEAALHAAAIAAVIARLKALAEARGREASPPVMRAMTNLKMALRNRVGADGFDKDTAHAIAEILDEAARKIERL